MPRDSVASPHMEGERRHLTVMFTDMVGFTVMGERLSEESIFGLIRRISNEQAQAIQAHGGVVQGLCRGRHLEEARQIACDLGALKLVERIDAAL
jgi:class 3 adenylate cyclase